MTKAIVLLSGGMDSLVTAAIAAKDCDEINFLHVDYGQKTMQKEAWCFDELVSYYKPKRAKRIQMMWLSEIGGSALTDQSLAIMDHSGSKEIPNTYVPFRNTNLISAAISWAEVIASDRIYIGAVDEDSSGYPDCREAYFQALQKLVSIATKVPNSIQIVTPLLHLSKAQIVTLGRELKAPFEYSWSCYRANDYACGTCDSCYLRLKAFKEAGFSDPIRYKQGGNE